jgi:hypothetical protein
MGLRPLSAVETSMICDLKLYIRKHSTVIDTATLLRLRLHSEPLLLAVLEASML